MDDAGRRDYLARFRRVLDFVDAHPDEALTVDALAGVAAFSRFHFHRQFRALFGVGASDYVRLVRMRRASHQLAFREARILEIALAHGYESHEAFGRAFKRVTGQTPSELRDRPQWDAWHARERRLRTIEETRMSMKDEQRTVEIVDFPETHVAALEHRGDPRRLGDTIRRFIDWRKASGVVPPASATYNLLHGDPATTPPDEFRLDLCAGTGARTTVAPNEQGVVARSLPAGRCARLRVTGGDAALGPAFQYLYGTWLPASGHELRDHPLFLERIRFFPDVPEHQQIVDVFLPLV